MKKLMVLAAIVAALVLAACGGGNNGNAPAMDAAASSGGQTVAVDELGDAGSVLVDSTGQALYTSDQEASGMVRCTDGCESFWEPLTIDRGQPKGSVPGKLGAVERPDGTRQVTYDGTPLYTFKEEGPGEVTGDGFSDAFDGRQFTWNVVAVGGSQGSPQPSDQGSGPPGY